MNLRRIAVLLGKELNHGTRNFIFVFAVVIPVVVSLVLTLIFGRLLEQTPRLGVLDEGNSRLVSLFQAQDYLDTRLYTDAGALRRDVERGTVEMGLILPPGFDEAARAGANTNLTIYFWGEGQVTNRALLVVALAGNIVTVAGRSVPAVVEAVPLGSGEIASWSERLLPLLVLMAIILGGTLIPAVSLVEEKQRRTLTALTITPATLADVITAKTLLGIVVSLAMGILILVLNRAFGTQPLLLVAVMALGAMAAAIFGILLGILTGDMNSLFTVVKSLGLVLYAPALIELIPQLPQWLARIFPTYYIIAPLIEISQNSAGWPEIAGEVVALVAIVGLLLAALLWAVGYQQRRTALA